MSLCWTPVDTRLGRFHVASKDGTIVRIQLPGGEPLDMLAALGQDFPHEEPAARIEEVLLDAAKQLQEYAEGMRTTFHLPIDPPGTAFQKAVWNALLDIPHGETRSYGDVAAAIGKPGAARAVGQANAANPTPIVVPCHRVLAADGGLGGWMGGGDTTFKQWLLDLEACGPLPLTT